jgi:hypothetical protein
MEGVQRVLAGRGSDGRVSLVTLGAVAACCQIVLGGGVHRRDEGSRSSLKLVISTYFRCCPSVGSLCGLLRLSFESSWAYEEHLCRGQDHMTATACLELITHKASFVSIIVCTGHVCHH